MREPVESVAQPASHGPGIVILRWRKKGRPTRSGSWWLGVAGARTGHEEATDAAVMRHEVPRVRGHGEAMMTSQGGSGAGLARSWVVPLLCGVLSVVSAVMAGATWWTSTTAPDVSPFAVLLIWIGMFVFSAWGLVACVWHLAPGGRTTGPTLGDGVVILAALSICVSCASWWVANHQTVTVTGTAALAR